MCLSTQERIEFVHSYFVFGMVGALEAFGHEPELSNFGFDHQPGLHSGLKE